MNRRMLGKEGLDQFGLVSREIVGDDIDLLAARGWLTTRSVKKASNSAEVCRAAVLPSTTPVLVLKAAYRASHGACTQTQFGAPFCPGN